MKRKEATKYLSESNGVGYLRIDKSSFPDSKFCDKNIKFGKARVLLNGKDISIICSGGIIEEAYKAAEELLEEGISCRIISMHTVKPIDVVEIKKAAEETQGIITLEEHTLMGGLGGTISEICMNNSIHPKFFKSIGLNDTFSKVVGSQKYLRNFYQMDSKYIKKQIKKFLD